MTPPNLGRLTILAPVPTPTSNFAPVWLAACLGYAAEEGLDLAIELAGTPKEAADGVASGRGDLTFINIVFALLARDRGVPLRPFYAFVRTQNRAFTVKLDSSIRQLSDLRGKTVGLHYDDPELFEFACAALRGAGLDPLSEVTFQPLSGSPLDAARMASAVRDGEVDAVWQLDVLSGFMAAEGVPTRKLPAPMIDRLTPSSSFMALDRTLAARPAAFAVLGRAVAKATVFALANPEAAVRAMWHHYPPREPTETAFQHELGALRVRLEGHRIEAAPVPKWGAISAAEIDAWQSFLLDTRAIQTRQPAATCFSDSLVADFNDFDPAPIVNAALELGSGHSEQR
jgi:NitT/TauT family transport system substrate-binding protein